MTPTNKQVRFRRNVSNCARRMIDTWIRNEACVHKCTKINPHHVATCLQIRWGKVARIVGRTVIIV